MAWRLKDSSDVRRYLASLINRLEAREIEPKIAGKCAYISNVLLRSIELVTLEDLDRRLAALEAARAEKPW